jgi:tetratricopeptide (TPR) repeat protein
VALGRDVAHDVFISYSPQDKLTADAACAVLEAEGIRCWIAPRDVTPGSEWSESIIDAIAEVRAFVLVFSGHANESGQIRREVERAVHHGIPIIPLRIEDIAPTKSLEYFISTPHWLDAFSPPLQQHLAHLAQVLHTVLAGEAGAPIPRPAPPAPPPPASPLAGIHPLWLTAGVAAVVIVAAILLRGHAPSAATNGVDASNAAPAANAAPAGYVPPPPPPSTAGMSPEWAACVTSPVDQTRIQACTGIIEAGHDSRQNLAVAYFNRGAAFDHEGEHQLAVDDDNVVLRVSPNDQETLTNRGFAYMQMGDYPPALADFNRAIQLLAKNPIAINDRGRVYMEEGQYDLAIADFNQAVHFDPTMVNAFTNRCEARARQNQQLSQALADCNLALSHMPNDADGLDARGLVYLRMNQPDPAIADFNAALKLDPKRAFSLYGRAVAMKAKTGQSDGADVSAAQMIDAGIAARFARFGLSA